MMLRESQYSLICRAKFRTKQYVGPSLFAMVSFSKKGQNFCRNGRLTIQVEVNVEARLANGGDEDAEAETVSIAADGNYQAYANVEEC